MAILSTKFSAPVKYGVVNAGKISVFQYRYTHTHVTNTKKSFYEKVFEAHGLMKEPISYWKERFSVANDKSEPLLYNFSERVRPCIIDNPPLSFEDFKRERLKSFEEYRDKHKKFYEDEIIKLSYEDYCQGCYKGYLIEREQINPGIIL